MASPVFVGLGSNLGDRERNLEQAIARIQRPSVRVVRTSPVYETEPIGYLDQPWFLNQVIEINEAQPEGAGPLMRLLLAVEREMGRERGITDGPRNIDIDLLFYGDVVEGWTGPADADVIVPHPRLHLRRFVLTPLCDIAPEHVHPVFGVSCNTLVDGLEDAAVVRLHS